MYDWDGAPARYRETPADAARRVRELIGAHAGETVTVQPAPHSPHGASPAMIRAGWRWRGRGHALSHPRGRGAVRGERTLAEHGATPIRYLDRLGVLGPRMIGVHCVWLDDEEIALMGDARRRARLLPVLEHVPGRRHHAHHRDAGRGVRIGLGTDGGCTNNRLSVFEEMRMAALLQKVRHLDGTRAVRRGGLRAWAPRGGRRCSGLDAGAIAAGRCADLVGVDLGHPSLHPRERACSRASSTPMSPPGGDRRLGARPPGRRAGAD